MPAEKTQHKSEHAPSLELKLYYWLCFPVVLLFVLMTGFMIYETTRVFLNETRTNTDTVLKQGAEQISVEIDKFENFATRWIEDFHVHRGNIRPHDGTVDARSLIYDQEGLRLYIKSGQGEITRYHRYIQGATIIMFSETLAQDSRLAREISSRFAAGMNPGWAEPLLSYERTWLLPYSRQLAGNQTLVMLVPLQALYGRLKINYPGSDMSTFLALDDRRVWTPAGSAPAAGDYLKIANIDDINNSALPHWTAFITGIRFFTLYHPEAVLPGLYIGLSYDDIDLYDRLKQYLLLGLLLAIAGTGLLYAVVRRGINLFSRSVTDLRDQLEIASSGSLDMQLPENQPYREINYITRMVNQLLRQLKDHVRQLQEEAERSASLASEIAIAGRIQQDLLLSDPDQVTGHSDIGLGFLLAPAKKIAGDFYCLAPRPDGKLLFAVGDVSGKGIAAALVAKDCVNLFDTYGQNLAPAQLLRQMNSDLFDRFARESMFVTMFCCLLDTKNGMLVHCDAGHETPLLYRAGNGEISPLAVERNMALGFLPDTPYKETGIKLEKDHTLLLYTDGLEGNLNRQDGTPGLPLGVTLLGNRMLDNIELQTKLHCIKDLALREQGGELYDDITLIGVTREKTAYRSFHIPPESAQAGNAISRLRAQLELQQVGQEDVNRLSVVLDEWLSNLVRYAGVDSDIIVCTRVDEGGVDMEIIASCNDSINPLQRPELDVYNHLQSHAAGGFGIHIIRNLVDDASYETEANWVRLVVRADRERDDAA